jgi:hypothetical protein
MRIPEFFKTDDILPEICINLLRPYGAASRETVRTGRPYPIQTSAFLVPRAIDRMAALPEGAV